MCGSYGPASTLIFDDAQVTIFPGVYTVSGVYVPDTVQSDGTPFLREIEVYSLVDNVTTSVTYSYGETFVVDDSTILVVCQSYNEVPVLSAVAQPGIYYQLYDRLAYFIYGEGVTLTGEQTLVLTIICTTLVLVCIALPFLACLSVCKLCRI